MTVVSVDVAYKDYRDVSIAALSCDHGDEAVRYELVRPDLLGGRPDAARARPLEAFFLSYTVATLAP